MTVLGGVGATFRARPLELGGRRQRAVLALLIVARGSVVTRDRLAEGVWGGRPPLRAAASLHAHVSHLRRCLEPEREARARGGVIVSEQAGYALRLSTDAVDAWRFEDALRSAALHTDEGRPSETVSVLESALALWRGPAYSEYVTEPWASRESTRLAELRELAREQLLAARLARGEDAVLVPELEALVSQDPLREERWHLFALALYRAHRQADALDALRRARQLLPAGPGTTPGALRDLEARILVFAGGHGQATEFARRAAAELPAELHDERQGLLALQRISGFMHGLDQRLWRTVEEPAVEGEGPGARMLAANLAREAASDGSDRARAVELARFAVADGVLQAAGEEMLWYTAGIVLHLADEEVDGLWDTAVARAVERGSLFSVLATHLWRGFTQWNHGDLNAARRSLETAVVQSEIWGLAPGAPQGRTFLTATLLDLGDTAGARACLERMRGWIRGAEGQRLLGESEARVLNAEGRYEEALAALDDVRHLQPATANPAWWPWSLLRVRALAGTGRRTEALTLAEEQLTVARGWGAPSTLGRALRIVGELRGPEGEPELREAAALLATGPARLEHARALHALAEHAPEAEAGALLSRGRHIARECGAAGLVAAMDARDDARGGRS